jgi:ketosteroid isomerase-like protein
MGCRQLHRMESSGGGRDTGRAVSEENVEIARQAAAAFDRRDGTAWVALHDEDFEVVAMDDWPEAGMGGPQAAWGFYGTIFDAFERVAGPSGIGDVQVVDATTDKVLMQHRPRLSGRESGAEVKLDYWLVVTIRQGKIVREQWFPDNADAIEAAGLRQ